MWELHLLKKADLYKTIDTPDFKKDELVLFKNYMSDPVQKL